jgi:hypothetical protein
MEYFQSKHINPITYKSGSRKQHDDGRFPHQLGFKKGEMKTSPFLNNKQNRKQKTIWNHHPHKTPKNFVASFSDNK